MKAVAVNLGLAGKPDSATKWDKIAPELDNAQQQTPPATGREVPGVLCSRLFLLFLIQAAHMCQQFRFAGPAREVVAQHLERSFARLVASPQCHQQTGDQGQVDLDRHAILTGGQQMLTAQNAFEPAEEKFRLPAIMPPKTELVSGRD